MPKNPPTPAHIRVIHAFSFPAYVTAHFHNSELWNNYAWGLMKQ